MNQGAIRFPMSSDEAYKAFSPYLWDYEKRELFEFKTIYFFPVEERKKMSRTGLHTKSSGGLSEMGMINE